MTVLYGADISAFQACAQDYSSKDFWFVKATEGAGYQSPNYGCQRVGAKNAGKVFGAYHFAHPDLGNTPEAEAAYFLNFCNANGGFQIGDLVALDYEVSYGDPVSWCLRWLQYVQTSTGIVGGIYLNQNTLGAYNWTAIASNNFWLWLAVYDDTVNVPAFEWWSNIAFKQYWNSPIDQDCFFGDQSALALYGLQPTQSPQPPQPPPFDSTAAIREDEMLTVVNTADATQNAPFSFPDNYNSSGFQTWFAFTCDVATTDLLIFAHRQDGSFLTQKEVTLTPSVPGQSGPTTQTFGPPDLAGYTGPYTLEIWIRSGGPVHVARHNQ